MHKVSTLPIPDEAALAHSARLHLSIAEQIAQHAHWISFADYMRMALYAPGLGYYTAGAPKLGRGGDFVTAPLISALFSQCLAQFCMENFSALAHADLLELGAGTGVMAKDILLFLEKQQQLPLTYFILEVSADLRARQQDYLQQHIPHLYTRITWLDALPENFVGVILANEVLDAMPVNLFHYRDQQLFEVGVGVTENRLVFIEKPADAPLHLAVELLPIEPSVKTDYLSEINLQLPAFLKSLQNSLQQGLIVFIDYGFDAQTYYHSARWQGTLMCHYRHHAHSDPFLYPGLQDITAHVDFTALAQAAQDCGLEVDYFATQARFLLENGLLTYAPQTADFSLAQQINTLTAPQEMGELFKVMVLSTSL